MLHNPVVSPPPAEGRNNLQKEMKPSLPSSRHDTVNSLLSAFRTLKLTPLLRSRTSWSFESDGHPPYRNKQSPSKRLLFGQKQIVYSVVFFIVLLFCYERTAEIYGCLYCVLTVFATLTRSSFRLIQPVQSCCHV